MKIINTALITAMLCATFSLNASESPLRILIVNDDGCESPGSTSLQDKLLAKGYDVVMVAPETNQSGVGSAITFKPGKIFDIKKIANNRYCFPGTPADALDFGLWGVLKDTPPELVISGVNDGPNTGMAQVNSGTVSVAIRALRYGIPAIAASIGYRFTQEEIHSNWPSTHKYWPDSVDYIVSVIDKINGSRQAGSLFLPRGTGFSINYPPLPKSEIRGIHFIGSEPFPVPQISYELMPDGRAKQILNPAVMKPALGDTDSGWLNKGYITYTLINGLWDSPESQAEYEALLGQ